VQLPAQVPPNQGGKAQQPPGSGQGKIGEQTPAQQTPAQQPPQPPPPQPAVDEKAAIQQTLNRLAAAYRSRDTNQVVVVYPTISSDDLGKLRQIFGLVNSYDLSYQSCAIATQSTSATAACHVVWRINYKNQGLQTFPADVTYRLEKRGGSWVIVGHQR
jgi:hypothetical protein